MTQTMSDRISAKCLAIENMLLKKNAAYGNSAMEPMRIFSSADSLEGIRVRIDDKLSRVKNKAKGEDSVSDLIGYLILLSIMEEDNRVKHELGEDD